jgi:Tol biopolymer transport system component
MEESRPSLLTKRLKAQQRSRALQVALVLLQLFSLSATFLSTPAQAGYVGDAYGISPFRNWRTIETDHFRINFPAEHERFAQVSADYLEESWNALTEQMYWKPNAMINVIVLDNSDAANGSASPFARFGITLYAIPPESTFSTSFTDDWIRLLIWHEVTHYINMDTTRSFYSLLRIIFGDTLLPNVVLPTWMLEGWAVYNETRFSRAGRGRSPYWESILRAGVAENRLGSRDWVTLDRVNGSFPWFPGGETPYFFGYQLMNQVAREPRLKQKDGRETRTQDGDNSFRDGEDALGLLSYRSGGRIPYFINGNLENLVSKDWYAYWADFIRDTQTRMSAQLAKIRSQRLTKYERLTQNGFNSLAPALSRDGRWLAYTSRTAEERFGLRLIDLTSGESTRLDDKLYGASMTFSPDSKWLIYSELNQRDIYDLYSDLHYREIPSGKTGRLTRGLRAKDPDLSADGLWLTYTVAEKAGNALAISPVEWDSSGPRVSPPRIIYRPEEFGRVANPRFSPDGKRIVFSVLQRGKLGEDLLEIDVDRETARALVADGHRNVFPAFSPQGDLYFVSSRSGVENLYRYRKGGKADQVTNLATGLWTTAFGPTGLYASILSTEGWDISKVELLDQPIDTEKVRVVADAAPAIDEKSEDQADHQTRTTFGYNPLKTLLPRVWSPDLQFSFNSANGWSAYMGALAAGFDTLDFHYYEVRAGYRTLSETVEGSIDYEFRGLGPTLGLSYSDWVVAATSIEHIRQRSASLTASIPVKFTWSTLTPFIGIGGARQYLYSFGNLAASSTFIPRMDVSLSWTDLNQPALAIHPIAGRKLYLGSRIYSDDGKFSAKGLFKYEENLQIWKFLVASPSLAASAIYPFETTGFQADNVLVTGSGTNSFLGYGPYASTLTVIAPRGYAANLSTPWVLYPALDVRFPLLRVFEGLGTNPVFAENLWMQAFIESAVTQRNYGAQILTLPSTGVGLRLDTTLLLQLPLVFSLDAIYAADVTQGGGFSIGLGVSGLSLPF